MNSEASSSKANTTKKFSKRKNILPGFNKISEHEEISNKSQKEKIPEELKLSAKTHPDVFSSGLEKRQAIMISSFYYILNSDRHSSLTNQVWQRKSC